jgi:hypothetical protein
MKYKFKFVDTEGERSTTHCFTAYSLHDVLQEFENFLRGTGQILDGQLEVVSDDDYECGNDGSMGGDDYSVNDDDDEDHDLIYGEYKPGITDDNTDDEYDFPVNDAP